LGLGAAGNSSPIVCANAARYRLLAAGCARIRSKDTRRSDGAVGQPEAAQDGWSGRPGRSPRTHGVVMCSGIVAGRASTHSPLQLLKLARRHAPQSDRPVQTASVGTEDTERER
jgi:hypothetical protein